METALPGQRAMQRSSALPIGKLTFYGTVLRMNLTRDVVFYCISLSPRTAEERGNGKVHAETSLKY